MCAAVLLAFADRGHALQEVSSPDRRLSVRDEGNNVRNVYYLRNGTWANLTGYKTPHEIYQYQMSPDGRYAFVWHMAYSPRVLSIYDVQALGLVRDLTPGFGGNVKWNAANELVHVYGCGSGCMGAKVFNLKGETVFEISGSPIEVSPSGRYLAMFTVSWVGKQAFELYDLAHRHLTRLPAPLATIGGVGQIQSIQWNDEKIIAIKYTDADIGGASPERQRYVTREVSIDLSRY